MNLSSMSGKWIKNLIQVELVTSERKTLRGPRLTDVEWRDYMLHFSCAPWLFPGDIYITHMRWVHDHKVLHTIPFDPVIHRKEGESFQFMGRLRNRNGIIENVV